MYIDGRWYGSSYGGWPTGHVFDFRGFDHMKDGDTKTIRLTMHRPQHPFGYGFSVTSEEVLDSTPWVLEP